MSTIISVPQKILQLAFQESTTHQYKSTQSSPIRVNYYIHRTNTENSEIYIDSPSDIIENMSLQYTYIQASI